MSINTRSTNIELPIKLIFTEEGSTALLTQKVKFSRFKMGDMSEEYGLSLDKVVPASLQRMIMADYISKIEVFGVEPVSNRSEIIDLSELIIYSILYRKYTFVSLEQILKTEPVKKWNHANPFQIIDEKTQFKEGSIQNFLSTRGEELAEIQKELAEPVYDTIAGDTALLEDEKKNRILITQNFITFAHPLVWFVLLKFNKSSDYLPLLREVRRCLAEFIKKSNIAEYTALMLMELASNIENLNILREAKLLYKTERVEIQRVLQDPKLRLPVIEELRKKNNLLSFSWKLGGTSLTAIGTRGRFQVFLYDQDANYKETRESLDATKAANVAKYNLSEYYKQLHKNGNDLELGIFYLSFLSEACETMGIKFESVVSQTQYTGKTITTLSFGL
ncbi:MAG: hypothetical protein LBP60_03085 [Spirochaetaceae bacterium]|jgi:hypothetical protein|nr:hypothetical protein [Spirochaetaceae bacterium]